MDSKIAMECIIHEHRNTESWVIKEDVATDTENMLIGAHLNIQDYFGGNRPILIFPIDHKPQNGQVFKDVYLLESKDVPAENRCFLANGDFLRNCLPKEVPETETENMRAIHSLDGLLLIFSDPDSHEHLEDLQKNSDCLIVGVYGSSPIHFSRGC